MNINRAIVTGNLTKDPELRTTGGGTSVCELRVAVNSSRKDENGNWVDKPNYFTVKAWGAQGENCVKYLNKGSAVAIDGRLDWHEWEAKDGSGTRQSVDIIAQTVQFLSQKGDSDGSGAADPSSEQASGAGLPF